MTTTDPQPTIGGAIREEIATGVWGEHRQAFRRQLEAGRLISRIEVERRPDAEDDEVVFHFGPQADPAVTPFQVPDL